MKISKTDKNQQKAEALRQNLQRRKAAGAGKKVQIDGGEAIRYESPAQNQPPQS
jgi:hypothetical protein